MKALHAQYPFLERSRSVVDEADVDLAELVINRDDQIIERARERVATAITDGTPGEPHRIHRVELLSYPIARILVSLVDERIVIRKFSRAEANRAIEFFEVQRGQATNLKSATDNHVTLSDLLSEFEIGHSIHRTEGGFRATFDTYIRFASSVWGDQWRLVNRTLSNGFVDITEKELMTLLREAVSNRVETGLPLSVPEPIADALTEEVDALKELIVDLELTREIDTVVPERFPPCMRYLIDQIQKGEHLAHHSRFAVTAFLANIGMSTDEIVDLYMVNSSFGERMTRYQTDHIRGDTGSTAYTPPSCATMLSYGDCINKDDLCETISHPLAYYERSLDRADEDELVDWRDRPETDEMSGSA